NLKLLEPEEKALYRYIDRLNYINLTVRPEFITNAINAILEARYDAKEGCPAPTISR
ncbi:hypothetical protein SODALDRAFT_286172, partial [Sodiomyces alkalinus F11]